MNPTHPLPDPLPVTAVLGGVLPAPVPVWATPRGRRTRLARHRAAAAQAARLERARPGH